MITFKHHIQWTDKSQPITINKQSELPSSLNGIKFSHSKLTISDSQLINIDESEINNPRGLYVSTGVVIKERDGRIWLFHPTNGYGGVTASFPKGRVEKGFSYQQNAIKEAYEETGLIVKLTGLVGDFTRSTSVTRYYSGVRIGGDPRSFHWETEAVSLVPKNKLSRFLNQQVDLKIANIV